MEHPVCIKYCDGDDQALTLLSNGHTPERERDRRQSPQLVVRDTRGVQRRHGTERGI